MKYLNSAPQMIFTVYLWQMQTLAISPLSSLAVCLKLILRLFHETVDMFYDNLLQ